MNENSKKLYEQMLRKGYPEEFAAVIASEMHTDWTSMRMMGYIHQNDRLPLEEVADEMLAIISDRDRIPQKHVLEHARASINRMYREETQQEEE